MRSIIFSLVIVCVLIAGAANGQEATRKVVVDFEGNKVFPTKQLVDLVNRCLETRSTWHTEYHAADLEYCLWKLNQFLASKGYLRGKFREPRREETENTLRVIVHIDEGALYRLGKVRIEGARLFAPAQILEMLTLKTGDTFDAGRLNEWLDNRVRKHYANYGYIQYSAEPEPDFHLEAGAKEGIADLTVTVDEGQAFTIRSIRFEGNGNVSEDELLREMLVRRGQVFNKELFDESLKRISQRGPFEMVDVDKDVDYRWDSKNPQLDLAVHLRKRAGT